MLKGDGPLGMGAFLVLQRAYLQDDADPTRVQRWRESKPTTAEWHDLGVGQLAFYLRFRRLYPIEPKRLSESEDKSIENKNAAMYADFQRLRASGMREREAVQEVAFTAGVLPEYVERIVEFRDTLRPETCVEAGCDRAPERGQLCMKHVMQKRRREAREEGRNAS